MSIKSNLNFETVKTVTFFEDSFIQYRASIINIDKETSYVSIAKFFQNPKNKGEFIPTRKQVFLKTQAFRNLIERGGDIIRELGVFIFDINYIFTYLINFSIT